MSERVVKKLEIIWVPGHMGSRGNEEADNAAKQAAMGETSKRRDLPTEISGCKRIATSPSAAKQRITTAAKRKWTKAWKDSLRYSYFRSFENRNRGNGYEKLVAKLRRNQLSVITQLRTKHIPLNFYLHCIKKADSPHCPHCPGVTENIRHLLFDCGNYTRARETLKAKAGREALSIRHLLSTAAGVGHLLEYLQGTRRFENIFGKLWSKEDEAAKEA